MYVIERKNKEKQTESEKEKHTEVVYALGKVFRKAGEAKVRVCVCEGLAGFNGEMFVTSLPSKRPTR